MNSLLISLIQFIFFTNSFSSSSKPKLPDSTKLGRKMSARFQSAEKNHNGYSHPKGSNSKIVERLQRRLSENQKSKGGGGSSSK